MNDELDTKVLEAAARATHARLSAGHRGEANIAASLDAVERGENLIALKPIKLGNKSYAIGDILEREVLKHIPDTRLSALLGEGYFVGQAKWEGGRKESAFRKFYAESIEPRWQRLQHIRQEELRRDAYFRACQAELENARQRYEQAQVETQVAEQELESVLSGQELK